MKKKLISLIALFSIVLISCSPVMALTINTENNAEKNTQTNSDTNTNTGANKNTNTNKNTTTGKTMMEVVEKNICEINLNDMGKFTKELTDFDAEKKEVTLTLTVKNTMEKQKDNRPIEIYLVLDNSYSMTKDYNGKSKMEYVKDTATEFTNALFEHFANPKIGLVTFSSIDTTTSGKQLGTLDDAKLLLPLSEEKETIKNKIAEYAQSNGQYTNIEAGLSVAQSNFTDSTTSKKHIILLSDGVPNLSLDTEHTLTYSGSNATNTKKRLQDMQTAGYSIFTVLMSAKDSDTPNPNAPMLDDGSRNMTYRELAEEIFGTTSNPTVGKFYFIDYENLAQTINEQIYKDITALEKDNTLKNIVIKDYFPQEIIDNFTFKHVKSPNIGKVTEKVDTSDNSITWNIELLNEGEVATLSYKLTLKENYNKEIINKILPTNSKVDINFETSEGKEESTSKVSPTVRVKYDDTVADKDIPQTGIYSTTLFGIAVIAIVGFAITRITKINKIK